MSSSIVMPKTRLVVLSVTWCLAVVASSVGLNALIKSKQDKSRLQKLAPAPAVVSINTSDIFNVGVAATTASLLIAILLSKFIIAPYLPFTKALAARTLRLQAILLSLATLMLIGTLIPFTIFYATRQADVKAFIGSIQLPDSAVRAAEAASHSTRVYRQIPYLKLVAYIPWFTLLFSIISIFVLLAASKKQSQAAAAVAEGNVSTVPMTEKETSSHQETIEKSSV